MKEKMKSMLEKIKTNKLRSTLILLSAFLFGFISVSIFNSIGDTYSIYEYIEFCPDGYEMKQDINGETWFVRKVANTQSCGPQEFLTCLGYGSAQGCSNYYCALKEDAKPMCYSCGGSQGVKYRWDYNDWGCSIVSNYTSKDTCLINNSDYGCFLCGGSAQGEGKYMWGEQTNSDSCEKQNYTSKDTCLINNPDYGCFLCSGSAQGEGEYKWGKQTNSNSCEKQNFNTKTICLEQNEPASCYLCDGKYSWQKAAENCIKHPELDYDSCTDAQGADDYGNTDSGNTDSGNTDSGNTDSGNTDSGNTDSGNTDSGNTDSGNTDSGNTDSGNTDSGNTETVTAYTRDFYKITYDLAGGEFIDGTTEREQWVTSDKAIGSFETVPIKEGYKFTGWLKEGQKFNFSVKPTSDITLVASYEAFEDSDKYQCNEGDKFDPTTMKCYKILADNANKDMYSYTTYSYDANEVFCYAYNSGISDGGIYPRVESSISIFGKNNVTYSGFEGQDDWLSNDSCKIASKCTNSQSESYDACSYTFSSIVYHSYDPVNLEEDIDIPSNGEDGSNSDNDSSDGGKTDEELTDKDAEDLKTGDALIILVWIVGISALGYTAYYFIRRNREN